MKCFFKPGDKCFSLTHGWGVVLKYNKRCPSTLDVGFTAVRHVGNIYNYLKDGRIGSSDIFPSLFKTKPKLPGEKKEKRRIETKEGWINIYPVQSGVDKVEGIVYKTEQLADAVTLSNRLGKAVKIKYTYYTT